MVLDAIRVLSGPPCQVQSSPEVFHAPGNLGGQTTEVVGKGRLLRFQPTKNLIRFRKPLALIEQRDELTDQLRASVAQLECFRITFGGGDEVAITHFDLGQQPMGLRPAGTLHERLG